MCVWASHQLFHKSRFSQYLHQQSVLKSQTKPKENYDGQTVSLKVKVNESLRIIDVKIDILKLHLNVSLSKITNTTGQTNCASFYMQQLHVVKDPNSLSRTLRNVVSISLFML